jgi:hypothetical protein
MKPRPRQIDIAPLAVFVICLALALPLMTQAGLPASPNSRSEAARILAMEDNLQAGILYPRWAQHFHYGYGSPLPNYLAPLPYYMGGLTLLITQSDAAVSLKILLVGAIFLAGFGMFFAVRRLSGTLPAFIASLVYVLAPTTVYHLALTDINLPFLTAAAIFPWVLWGADRLLRSGDGRDFLLLALCVGFLVMSANLMGPLLLSMGMVWLLWRFFTVEEKRAPWWMLFSGAALGIGLATIYWLPAIIEWHEVRWLPIIEARDTLTLFDMIRPFGAVDFDLLNRSSTKTPGFAALILGVAGLWKSHRGPYLPFAVMALALMILALIPGGWLDDAARFPSLSRSDLMLPVTICCALLAASVIEKLPDRVWLRMALVAVGTVAAAYPILQARPFISIDTSRQGYLQAELNGAISGSFRDGQLLPASTRVLPDPSSALIDSFTGEVITKIERTGQMPRANLAVLQHSPTRDRLRVNLPGAIDLDVLTLHYPGWQARYQGGEIPLERRSNGLLRVQVPAGAGILDIHFAATPNRTAGTVITLASLLLVMTVSMIRRPLRAVATPIPSDEQTRDAIVVLLGLLVTLLIFVGRALPQQSHGLAQMTPLQINFASDVRLLGFELSQESTSPGDTLLMTVYLQAISADIPNYALRAALISTEDGQTLAESQVIAPGGWFSSEWPPDRTIQEHISLGIPSDAAPGSYQIALQLIGCESQANIGACEAPFALLSFDARGRPLGDTPEISIR